jgi:protein-tyrosine phosphatase
MKSPFRVLFVCMGNICRSPTAEAVTRKLLNQAGLQAHIEVDSAGTHGYHVGKEPDPRACAAALRRGVDLSGLRARQITANDLVVFDLVLAMDFNNMEFLQRLCPPDYRSKIGMLMPYATGRRALIVHDPFHREARDFDLVFDYIEDACKGVVDALAAQLAVDGNPEGVVAHHFVDLPLPMRGRDPAPSQPS